MVGERKQRSDRKRDVKMTVDIYLKEAVYRLAYRKNSTIKDLCESMIKYAMSDQEILSLLSAHFIRDLQVNSTLYRGSLSNPHVAIRINTESDRMTTRLTSRDFNKLSAIAYALDVRPARASSLLIELVMNNQRFHKS